MSINKGNMNYKEVIKTRTGIDKESGCHQEINVTIHSSIGWLDLWIDDAHDLNVMEATLYIDEIGEENKLDVTDFQIPNELKQTLSSLFADDESYFVSEEYYHYLNS